MKLLPTSPGQLLLVAIALGLGVAIAGGFRSNDAASSAQADAFSASSQESLQRIEALLVELLAAVRTAPLARAQEPNAGPPSPQLTGAVRTTRAEPSSTAPGLSTVARDLNTYGATGELLPTASNARLDSLTSWDEDDDLRRQWMFTSEHRALEWFGTPSQVTSGTGGSELWHYHREEGSNRVSWMLTFLRGRLTRID